MKKKGKWASKSETLIGPANDGVADVEKCKTEVEREREREKRWQSKMLRTCTSKRIRMCGSGSETGKLGNCMQAISPTA